MSEFVRIGIVTSLLVVLLSIGSAVGFTFYFNSLTPSPRPATGPKPLHLSPDLARSGKTDSVFDIRQRLGEDGHGRPSLKTATAEPSSGPIPEPPPFPAAVEPKIEPSGTIEQVVPATKGSIRAAAVEPDLRDATPPENQQRSSKPAPSKPMRAAPCRSEACRQATAECSKLCDTAMTLSVAACPRVAKGASEKDEKACLARWDRRRRDCHSGCALQQSRASKMPSAHPPSDSVLQR